ncbi:probable salivary secreted peptide [Battus philenor]|uniref:probable salivary secreted peptide n=1 Tax=Battus philenor TaxID=42288 RepID=UPI0035CEEE50
MKTLFVCTVLAVLVAGLTSSVVRSPSPRSSLYYGYVRPGDRLLNRTYVQKLAIANTFQTQDVVYRGNLTTRITAVQVIEVGYTQYATPWLLSGGVGYNNVSIRIQSARGYGYNYVVDIWGR